MIDLMEIKDPSFVKNLSKKELRELCKEIRRFLIESISETGGHLSSNLGVVELTVAMYYVFDPEVDKFIFDVGHQSYVHKILTGRAKDFKTLRQFGGMSGYINRKESKYDIWESGHSSTSISAMTGMMLASDNPNSKVISFIGDSAMMNGVATEAINFLGSFKGYAPIIILNDNKMGITKSVGALSRAFDRVRGNKVYRGTKKVLNKVFPTFITHGMHQIKRGLKGLIQNDNYFEDLGFDYYGPYDGNELDYCIKVLKKVKKSKDACVVHFLTKKGKGYEFSEADKTGDFHGVPPFDIATGKPLKEADPSVISYSQVVADYLIKKRAERQFFVVTPAMMSGSKLEEFSKKYPADLYDVGIAEEHAAVMSAGMAIEKKDVVLLMYSTFAQRAYDEILNDIARQNLKVIIGIDRAGIVGEDGSTHQGIYDVAMFMQMPNIKVCMPKNQKEATGLFNYAFEKSDTSIVIRYPRGNTKRMEFDDSYICDLSWEFIGDGSDLAVVTYGSEVERLEALNISNITIVNARCIKPMDNDALAKIFNSFKKVLVIEQAVSSGTLYHKMLEYKEINNCNSKVYNHSFTPDTIIVHGAIKDVYEEYGLSDNKLLDCINEILKK